MSRAHSKSILPLKQWCVPVDPVNTKFLAHYDITDRENLTGTRPIGSYPDDLGCVLYYDFSTQRDRAYDLSGSDNHGTFGGCTWVGGKNGKAIKFNGTDSYIELTRPLGNLLSGPLTISTFCYINESDRVILFGDYARTNSSDTNFEITATQALRLYWGSVDIATGGGVVPLNQWCLLSVVRDKAASKVFFYVNGVLVYTYNGAISDKVASSLHLIGRDGRTGITDMDGSMDKFMLYNRALPAAELVNHYNAAIATLRADGKYGRCIEVTEASSNMITSDKVKFEGWTNFQGCSTVVTQNQIVPEWGATDATRLQITGGTNAVKYVYYFTRTAGDPESFSVWIKNIGSTTARMQITAYGSPGTVLIPPGQSKLLAVSTAATDTTSPWVSFGGQNASDNVDIIVWRPMLEKKAFPTAFVDGARVDGRVWYPNPIPGASEFTISFWGRMPGAYKGNTSNTETLLCIDTTNLANNVNLDYSPSDGNIRFFSYNSASAYSILSYPMTRVALADWHHFLLTKLGTAFVMYIDGTQVGAATYSGTLALTGDLKIGDRLGIVRPANVHIDELRIDSRGINADEAYSWYASSAPFYPKGIHRVVG